MLQHWPFSHFNRKNSGSFDLNVNGISITLTIAMKNDPTGRPVVSVANCAASVASAKIKFRGGARWNKPRRWTHTRELILENTDHDFLVLPDIPHNAIVKSLTAPSRSLGMGKCVQTFHFHCTFLTLRLSFVSAGCTISSESSLVRPYAVKCKNRWESLF